MYQLLHHVVDNEDVAIQGLFGQLFTGKGQQGHGEDARKASALLW